MTFEVTAMLGVMKSFYGHPVCPNKACFDWFSKKMLLD